MVALFRRANLVYFRHTQHSPELLTPAILARAKKRSYANYLYQRTANIWATRDDLLAYEQALELEAEVDTLLEGPTSTNGSARERSTTSRTPAPTAGRPTTPATPAKGGKATSSPVATRSPCKAPAGVEEEESVRTRNAREVKAILDQVLPKWQALVEEKGEEDPRRRGLERFHHGGCIDMCDALTFRVY